MSEELKVSARHNLYLALGVTAVVCAILWWPGEPPRPTSFSWPRGTDKVVHIGLFAAVSLAWYRVWFHRSRPGFVTSALVGALALLTEVVQHWVPQRSFDVLDIVADGLGLAVVVFWLRSTSKERS